MPTGSDGISASMVCAIPWTWGAEIRAFLSYLTNECHVSVSPHKQALCALLFLYKQVLESDFPWLDSLYHK